MPRGKYVNHKGRSRNFTNPEELERQRQQDLFKKKNRGRGDESSDEEDEETVDKAAANKPEESEGSTGSESESESDEDGNKKAKGVEGLIEIENPNRVQKKQKKAAKTIEDGAAAGPSAKPELSRREREEIERQKAKAHYQKLHAEGKTEEARQDLARLAIIKKQREEAAKKREEEKKAKEAAKAAKQDQVGKALGKKS